MRSFYKSFSIYLPFSLQVNYLNMVRKNHGPCSVRNCNSQASRFRQFTSLAYEKAQKKGTYEAYTYLRIGQQLCHNHYMSIVEPYQKSEVPLFLEPDENITNRKYYM